MLKHLKKYVRLENMPLPQHFNILKIPSALVTVLKIITSIIIRAYNTYYFYYYYSSIIIIPLKLILKNVL